MPDLRPLPRRTLLGGVVGASAWLLAGCTTHPSGPSTSGGPRATPTAPALPPDVRTAVALVSAYAAAGHLLESAGRRRWGRRYHPLAQVLEEQRGTLAGAVPRQAPAPKAADVALPRRRQRAERALADRVDSLHVQLVDAAVGAESGGFARLLASMAAGIDQQLTLVHR